MYIKIDTIPKINEFVKCVSKIEGRVNEISGEYIVDAKSIMGLYSLDLSTPILIAFEDSATNDEKNMLRSFEINEAKGEN